MSENQSGPERLGIVERLCLLVALLSLVLYLIGSRSVTVALVGVVALIATALVTVVKRA